MPASIGTDPEFFVFDKDENPVGAHNFYEDKHNKHAVNTKGIKVFRDGYAIEVNVPGNYCRALLSRDMQTAMLYLGKQLKAKGYHLKAVPTVKVDLAALKDAPADMKTFGCDPSLDAIKREVKYPTINADGHPFRYAGGHMHFSVPAEAYEVGAYGRMMDCLCNPEEQPNLVKLFDLYIGLPLTAIFDYPETYLRRKYYGGAGEYRNQKYPDGNIGVEYRTPGPEIWNHHAVAGLAFGVGRWVIDHYWTLREQYDEALVEPVVAAINDGKDLFKLMQTVPGYYSPEVIQQLAEKKMFRTMELATFSGDTHNGWTELMAEKRITLPRESADLPIMHLG